MSIASLTATCDPDEVIVVRDRPTCGLGWREGAEQATGDYVLLSCDDVEWLPEWLEAAVAVCASGALPAPVIRGSDGLVASCGGSVGVLELEGAVTEFTRAPFLSREQLALVGPILPTHYFCDNFVSFRGRQVGIETVVAYGYQCVHRDAQAGKERVAERLYEDRLLYERYCSGELVS